MNKKLFLGMFAAAGMLLATSCSNDELDAVLSENEAQVTFSLGLEGGIATRAISDGTGADVLMYAVFDKDGNRINTIQKVSKTGVAFPTTENITLAKGQTYKVAFWAQDEACKAYTVSDDMQVTVDYATNNTANNDETRDAFFKTIEFTVNGSTSLDVELKRPFAQINVGVTAEDWDAAVASGIEIEKSAVVVKHAANTINLLTGAVDGNETVVTYVSGVIPDETLYVETDATKDGKEAYNWLSMSYILVADANDADVDKDGTVGDEKTTLEGLQFTFYPKNGNAIEFKEGLNSVPVQRNWRTNILGKILTGDIEFDITIDPAYDDDYLYPDGSPEQELEFAATFGGTVNLPDNATVTLKKTLNVNADMVINMNGSTINGPSEAYDADGNKIHAIVNNANLTIIGGTIKSGATNGGSAIKSTGNLTLEGVTLEGAPYGTDNDYPSYALNIYGENTTLKNVTINGVHGALGVSEAGTTVLENCNLTVTGGKFNNHVFYLNHAKAKVVVKGGTYANNDKTGTGSYWVCVDQEGGELTIENGTFSEDTKTSNNLYVKNAETGKIIVKGGTFKGFDPTNFCAEGYASSKVGDDYIVAEEGKKFVLTQQDFQNALADPDVEEIILTDDITLSDGLTFGAAVSTFSLRAASTTLAGRDIVIDGNGSTISFESVPSDRLIDVRKEASGINFTLKNITLLNNTGTFVERGINYNTNGTLTLDNVTIKNEGSSTMNYAVHLPANSDNATVIINNSNIGATSNALNLWGEKTTANVTNSDLYIIDNSETESYAVIALNNDGINIADYSVVTVTGGSLKVTGSYPNGSNAVRNSTINGKVEISTTTEVVGLIQEYKAIVYYEGHDNFYSFTTLQSALDKVANDATAAGVRMLRSTNDFAVNNKAPYRNYYGVKHDGFTLDGNGNTLDFELGELNDKGVADNYGIMTSGGTIKNMTITGVFRGIMIMNPTETVNIDNVTIGDKDVCYAINTGEGDGTQDLVVTNSTIKGWSSYGTAINSVSFKDCTFAQGEYYIDVYGRLVKPYVDCVFENCEFGSKFYIDLSALTTDGDGHVVNPDAKVTLKNCTVNGVKLTKDNWKQLIAAETSCGEGQISIELKDGSYLTADNVVDYVVFE